MRRTLLSVSLVALFSLAAAGVASARTPAFGFTFVGSPGSGGLVHPGDDSATAAQLQTTQSPYTWSGVKLSIPPQMKLHQLNNLATDYMFVVGSCGGGSPRFEAWVTTPDGSSHKIFFYIGPPPNYTGCPLGTWANTGNLASPASLIDDSELSGGSPYDTYSNAQAKYGSYPVTEVALDADGGWNGDQTVDFDNTRVNSELFTYES